MARTIEMHICLGSSCFARGNKDTVSYIRDFLKKNHLDDRVVFRGSRCMGNCNNGPNLTIDGKIYGNVTVSNIEAILDKEFGTIK